MTKTITVIGGPTASGKSGLAMALARAHGHAATIINADSMQLYGGLPNLTAQPPREDMLAIPHRLYGTLNPGQECSAGDWRELAEPVIAQELDNTRHPIIVGGSGLYLNALLYGLAPIPDTPPEIREAAGRHLDEIGYEAFFEEIHRRDPRAAARISPANRNRMIRVWEVYEHTGIPLSEWQKEKRQTPPADWCFQVLIVLPDRMNLRYRCDVRLDQMVEAGVLAEIEAFEHAHPEPGLPPKKALGYRPFLAYLKGQTDWPDAIERAKAETRQYAKRQVTWFRHQVVKQGPVERVEIISDPSEYVSG